MNRRLSVAASATTLSLLTLMAACAVDKSSNPLTPTVAGPIPGVNITSPGVVQPTSGTRVAVDQQPVTLTVRNASTSGVRPLSYLFEVATDVNFNSKVLSRDGIQPGDGQTSLRLSDPLATGRSYYWRARAQDGANTGPFSNADFVVYTPVVFQPPTPVSPINNAVITSVRPHFVFTNAPRTGPAGAVTYMVEVSETNTFASVIGPWYSPEGSGQTILDAPQDVPAAKTLYWHVRAYDPSFTGPWSATQSFQTPGGGVSGGGSGNSLNWSTEEWHQYVLSLIQQKSLGPVVTVAALAAMKPDLNARGTDVQHDSGGNLRPRLYLPTGDPNNPFSRAVDLGDFNGPWQWIPR